MKMKDEKGHGNDMPYMVPDTFWDELETGIEARIKEEEAGKRPTAGGKRIRTMIMTAASVAAVAAVLIVCGFNLHKKNSERLMTQRTEACYRAIDMEIENMTETELEESYTNVDADVFLWE